MIFFTKNVLKKTDVQLSKIIIFFVNKNTRNGLNRKLIHGFYDILPRDAQTGMWCATRLSHTF